MMNFLRRCLSEDQYNIELRHYCLIELISNEKWFEIIDILEETPCIQLHLVGFVFKFFPLTMIDNERVEKLKQRLKSFQMNNKKDLLRKKTNPIELVKNSFELYRNELTSSSSSSSSSSVESFHQTSLFLSKAKFYKKYFHWSKIGRGECEIIENNQSG